jgi:hypothetical protein
LLYIGPDDHHFCILTTIKLESFAGSVGTRHRELSLGDSLSTWRTLMVSAPAEIAVCNLNPL